MNLAGVDGRQVEPDLAVRAARTTFEVEHLQRVVLVGLIPALAQHLTQILGTAAGMSARQRTITVRDLAGREVDGTAVVVVDAAQIERQLAVEVHPHIVIALELEDHVVVVDLAILRHHELRGNGHTEVVVSGLVQSITISAIVITRVIAQ